MRLQCYFIRINCPKDNMTMHGIISLRSNITRRKANKTAECPYEHSANGTDLIILVNSKQKRNKINCSEMCRIKEIKGKLKILFA